MKLEYIILTILAIGFYETSINDYKKRRANRDFVNNNLKLGSKIKTYSGILGEVISIENERITIISGTYENNSYLTIDKSEIEHIIN